MTSAAQLKAPGRCAPIANAEAATRRSLRAVEIGLNAAIVAVAQNEPVALIIRGEADWSVPPTGFRSDRSRRCSTARSRSV